MTWELLEKLSPAKGNERYVLEIYGRQYRSTDPNFDIAMDAAVDGIRRYQTALRTMAKS
jgi:hypothetical protein